jgi:hypothetical protein
MLRRVALVRTELSASLIRMTRIGELGTTLMKEELSSSETSVLTRATRRNIPEDAILNKFYIFDAWFLTTISQQPCKYIKTSHGPSEVT